MLPPRQTKPRTHGITAVADKGVPATLLQGVLASYGDYVDFAKFGIGSGLVEPRLAEKVEFYRSHDVDTYFGGTLFEKFYHFASIDRYLEAMREVGIGMLEVSEGSRSIPLSDRAEIVRDLSGDYRVLAEVGTKDTQVQTRPQLWIEEIRTLLDAGAEYVVTEGRDSGTAGVFTPAGELRVDLIEEIVEELPVQRIIFEAPTEKAQMYFINRIGPDVNLGNVAVDGLLMLEAQRCGLRYETFELRSDSDGA